MCFFWGSRSQTCGKWPSTGYWMSLWLNWSHNLQNGDSSSYLFHLVVERIKEKMYEQCYGLCLINKQCLLWSFLFLPRSIAQTFVFYPDLSSKAWASTPPPRGCSSSACPNLNSAPQHLLSPVHHLSLPTLLPRHTDPSAAPPASISVRDAISPLPLRLSEHHRMLLCLGSEFF